MNSFIVFGGKGGVGKTTLSAALAVASARSGRRVLVVSTDPAHSLGDVLGIRVSSRLTRVPLGASRRTRAGTLSAIELDAPRAFARWLRDHRPALADILEHGTWLDRKDVDELLGLPIPGVDELIGLMEIVRLAEAESGPGRYDLIVVDTAPTGHALRLLESPDTVTTVAQVLDSLQDEHRMIRERFARLGGPEAADRFIDLLRDQARQTSTLIRDAARTSFRWVMLPESLSLAETADALAVLDAGHLPVAEIVINRVTPEGPRCGICDGRRVEESRVIARAARTVARKRGLRMVPAREREPRGLAALGELGRRLVESRVHSASARLGELRRAADQPLPRLRRSAAASAKAEATGAKERTRPLLSSGSLRDARLLFFGGKGGTGKTTTAAATAIALARDDPARRVLLLSVDPAHSLGDVFDAPVGDGVVAVEPDLPNLHLRELDAVAALSARRADIDAALDEIAAAFGAGTVTLAGSRGLGELMDLAPPGIDELLGLVSVMELIGAHQPSPESERLSRSPEGRKIPRASRYDMVIVDAAPTGHALRLLEMPDAARDWIQLLLRMLLKYRELARPGRLAAELLDLSKSIRALQQLLRNPELTRFIVVTRAAEVPRRETERLLKQLERLGVAVRVTLVNAMTLTPGRCPRCRATANAERRQLAPLARACRRAFADCAIIQTPLVAPPPRGVEALERWARRWMS